MGILKKGLSALFGRSETTDSLINAAISTGDKMVFTEEERSDVNLLLVKSKIEFAKASSGSRLARRVLAIAVTFVYLFVFMIACALVIAGGFMDITLATGEVIRSGATLAAERLMNALTSLAVGGAFVTIISWYFVAGISRTNGSQA